MDLEIVLDGGNVVRWDGRCFVTDKVFFENPDADRTNLIGRLREDLRVVDLIAIPKELCDVVGHADGVVRFLDDRLLVINDYSTVAPWYGERLKSIPRRAGLEWIILPHQPQDGGEIPSAVGCYANFLMVRRLGVGPELLSARGRLGLSCHRRQHERTGGRPAGLLGPRPYGRRSQRRDMDHCDGSNGGRIEDFEGGRIEKHERKYDQTKPARGRLSELRGNLEVLAGL